MCPFELVATPIASPRYTSAGIFRKFGTDSNGISGTFCAFALWPVCARPGAVIQSAATITPPIISRLISSSCFCYKLPATGYQLTSAGYRRRHVVLDPVHDELDHVVTVLLEHHHVAVAADADLLEANEVGLDARLVEELRDARIVDAVIRAVGGNRQHALVLPPHQFA